MRSCSPSHFALSKPVQLSLALCALTSLPPSLSLALSTSHLLHRCFLPWSLHLLHHASSSASALYRHSSSTRALPLGCPAYCKERAIESLATERGSFRNGEEGRRVEKCESKQAQLLMIRGRKTADSSDLHTHTSLLQNINRGKVPLCQCHSSSLAQHSIHLMACLLESLTPGHQGPSPSPLIRCQRHAHCSE